MLAEIIYGGRVTDNWDRRLMGAITVNYFNPEVLKDGYKFSKSGLYYSPQAGNVKDYINYIESLPKTTAPEAFGLYSSLSILQGEK